MKKTMLSFLCITAACVAGAQEPIRPINNQQPTPVNNTQQSPPLNNGEVNTLNEPVNKTTLSSTTRSAAYSVTVPSSVQTSFQAAYPAAGTVVWSQSGDWYRARYMENGKIMESSYREDGKTMTRMASPQLRTFVPEEVVNAAMNMYGVNVYAIAQAKGAEGDVYNVTIIENGEARTEWMNADGSSVASPYRTETDEMNTEMKQPAEATETTPVNKEQEATENSNSTTPVEPVDDLSDEQMAPETLEQGTENDIVDPANNLNQEALKPENELESERVRNEYSPEDDPYYYYY